VRSHAALSAKALGRSGASGAPNIRSISVAPAAFVARRRGAHADAVHPALHPADRRVALQPENLELQARPSVDLKDRIRSRHAAGMATAWRRAAA
jgi:hypothetical protein